MDSERLCGAFPEHPPPALEIERRNLERPYGGFPELEAPNLGMKVAKKGQVGECDGFQETLYSLSHSESMVTLVVYLYTTWL
jgi:hypothetical protein